MIEKLNNVLLGLLAVILAVGVYVIVKGADNMSVPLRSFLMGILAMVFLMTVIVTWLKSQVMKKRREKR
jgi:hypothetical protein